MPNMLRRLAEFSRQTAVDPETADLNNNARDEPLVGDFFQGNFFPDPFRQDLDQSFSLVGIQGVRSLNAALWYPGRGCARDTTFKRAKVHLLHSLKYFFQERVIDQFLMLAIKDLRDNTAGKRPGFFPHPPP